MEIIEALINLGLNEKEAKVYLALLPLEKATAYTVATRSGLKKPTAYVILDNLVAKGFALKIPHQDKHYFLAKSPKECIAIAREKLSTATDMLPELMAMQKRTDEKANVSYYEGFDGVKEMYRLQLQHLKKKPISERKFVAFYAHAQDTPDFMYKFWLDLGEKYADLNLRRRAVTTLHPSIKYFLNNQEHLGLDLHPLPEKNYSSNISVEIYDNYTQILSHRHLQDILIDNPDIADVMKQIFELVWKNTEASDAYKY